MHKHRLVVIDDHHDTLELLKYNLTKEDYEVKGFLNAVDALKFITDKNTDLVMTDWMLPEMDGLDLCRNLKLSPVTCGIPLVMMTCKNDEADVVTALELGAEDYIVKPIRMRELLVRLKKILRRDSVQELNRNRKENGDSITLGNLKVDLSSYKVYLQETQLDLTIGEFKLIALLVRYPDKVFSRTQIIEKINGADYFATERSIDVQIVGLRRKLGSFRNALETVRSVGYRFNKLAIV
jgi:DNA-binding response OmpR family regulator